MSAVTVDYLNAIEHLPAGATLRLNDVSWDEYEALLDQMGNNWPGYRVSYDGGRLEIMSPRSDHESPKEFILSLARVLSEETDTPLQTYGSTTYRRRSKLKGAEPDTSFYVQNAARVIGRKLLDFEIDPPPDVVVEIDTTNESQGKFKIYAALGVTEIWLYDGERATFFRLVGDEYQEIADSIALPSLTASALTDYIAQSETQGQSAALKAFRRWCRTHAPSAE